MVTICGVRFLLWRELLVRGTPELNYQVLGEGTLLGLWVHYTLKMIFCGGSLEHQPGYIESETSNQRSKSEILKSFENADGVWILSGASLLISAHYLMLKKKRRR